MITKPKEKKMGLLVIDMNFDINFFQLCYYHF